MRRELPGGFELDDDRERIDIDAVHAFISTESYWGIGRAREIVERAVARSTRVIGVYSPEGRQIGFARSVSDETSVAYLADVYVLRDYRQHGLGLALVREMIESAFEEVRWLLHTADAQRLYSKVGFTDDQPPYVLMERRPARGAAPPAPRQ